MQTVARDLSDRPLKNSAGFDTTPKKRRHVMTLDEIAALRRASPRSVGLCTRDGLDCRVARERTPRLGRAVLGEAQSMQVLTLCPQGTYGTAKNGGGGGNRKATDALAESRQNDDNSIAETTQIVAQQAGCEKEINAPNDKIATNPTQTPDTFLHEKCALCVHLKNAQQQAEKPSQAFSCDEVVRAWADLPAEIKVIISAIVRRCLNRGSRLRQIQATTQS